MVQFCLRVLLAVSGEAQRVMPAHHHVTADLEAPKGLAAADFQTEYTANELLLHGDLYFDTSGISKE